jgi:20S proteasome subunit alpha 6
MSSKNENCVVLAALKRKQSKLSSTQEKIFMVNSKVGVAVSGLSTDGARLVKFLREESSRTEFVYELIASPSKLASTIAKALQVNIIAR